jgi:thioredoxin-related protein
VYYTLRNITGASLIILVLLTALLVYPGIQHFMQEGEHLPSFHYTLQGKRVSSNHITGPLLLVFIKKDCPHCKRQIDIIRQEGVYQTALKIHFICRERDFKELQTFMASRGRQKDRVIRLAYISAVDLRRMFKYPLFPTMVFVKQDGKIFHIARGIMETARFKAIVRHMMQ